MVRQTNTNIFPISFCGLNIEIEGKLNRQNQPKKKKHKIQQKQYDNSKLINF